MIAEEALFVSGDGIGPYINSFKRVDVFFLRREARMLRGPRRGQGEGVR